MSLQKALADLGFYSGPIDGVYSAATIAAVRAFQASIGVPQTGIIDAATVRAVYDLGAASIPAPPPAPPPETTTTVPPTTTTTAKPAPTTTTTKPAPTTTEAPATTKPAPTTTEAPATTTTEAATTSPPTTVSPPPEQNIVDVLTADPRFTTYLELATEAGVKDALAVLGPVTVFAPTNDAFAAMPPGQLDALRSDPTKLQAFLMGGMAKGRLTSDDLTSGTTVTGLSGNTLTIGRQGSTVTVNGAPLLTPELDASNGIVHPMAGVPAGPS